MLKFDIWFNIFERPIFNYICYSKEKRIEGYIIKSRSIGFLFFVIGLSVSIINEVKQ